MLEKITPDDICIEFIYFFGISKFRQEGFSLIRERGPRSRAMTTTLIIGWLSGPPIDRIWSILQSQSAWSGEKIFGAGIVKFFQWTLTDKRSKFVLNSSDISIGVGNFSEPGTEIEFSDTT